MFRIAILSFWHVHAKDYIREANSHPDAEIVACWDEVPERGRSEAERRGISFHEDLDELLAREDVDGVVVTTPTVAHRELIPTVAAAGKHVFAEKVIAPTKQQAEQVIAATEREGVTFVVSLPKLYAGYTKAIKQTINEGLLGEVTYLRPSFPRWSPFNGGEPQGLAARALFRPRRGGGRRNDRLRRPPALPGETLFGNGGGGERDIRSLHRSSSGGQRGGHAGLPHWGHRSGRGLLCRRRISIYYRGTRHRRQSPLRSA